MYLYPIILPKVCKAYCCFQLLSHMTDVVNSDVRPSPWSWYLPEVTKCWYWPCLWGFGLEGFGLGLSRILGHGSSPIFASVDVVKLTIAYYCHEAVPHSTSASSSSLTTKRRSKPRVRPRTTVSGACPVSKITNHSSQSFVESSVPPATSAPRGTYFFYQ